MSSLSTPHSALPTSILAIDQGTTSTRAIVYRAEPFTELASASCELQQHYPMPGWVEHDPEEIWASVADVVPRALAKAQVNPSELAAIGLTNQRETVVLWDRQTGRPAYPAIVWQDRRTTDFCRDHAGDQDHLRRSTGLVLDPYFSATKIRWLLEQDAELRRRAEMGQIAFGTVDSFLLYRLTGGKVHATDQTNASRTLLFGLHSLAWEDELCRYFAVPPAMLPTVHESAARFGTTLGLGFLPDGIPITGIAGDQQAALFGQRGFQPGDAKCTYGTGAFFLLHTGSSPVLSSHQLLTTVAATTGAGPRYALEGSVFIAGAAVQWLRDALHLISTAAEVEKLAEAANPEGEVIFVPAFTGLGAPHWVPEARGVLFGLTRGTTAGDIARATLDGIAFQVADLLEAAAKDLGQPVAALRVDGGVAANDWFLQRQADLLGLPLLRAPFGEATARGAALLAGIGAGIWSGEADLTGTETGVRRFEPVLQAEERERRLAAWRRAVRAVIAYAVG